MLKQINESSKTIIHFQEPNVIEIKLLSFYFLLYHLSTHMTSNSQQTHTSQTYPLDTTVLLTEIKHLKQIIQKKDIQIEQKDEIISFYRSYTLKDNQQFCLIVMLFSEIQRLKNRIKVIESQDHVKCPNHTNENLKKQLRESVELSDIPNFSLLKELQECVGRLFSCYKPSQMKEAKDKQFLSTPISSTETYQSSSFIDPFKQSEKIPSSTSLAQSIYINSQASKDSQDYQEYFPLYTPIKNKCRLVTFGNISSEKSLGLSTDSLTSQGSLSLDSESMRKQIVITPKNQQNNSLAFLSHRRKVSLATSPEHQTQQICTAMNKNKLIRK